MAAAVGSLINLNTCNPAAFAARIVAARDSELKLAGTVITQ